MHINFYDKKGHLIDFYQVFNLPYNADLNQIKSAFHLLIKLYHPDTTNNYSKIDLDKIEIIIRAYKILSNISLKKEYDKILSKNNKLYKKDLLVVPHSRIKYSASLHDMLQKRFLPKKVKRKDILSNYGQDIEILITKTESLKGAIAFIDLPANMYCPLCQGMNPECYMCDGLGKINTSARLKIDIEPNIKTGTTIKINLSKFKPDKFTSFKAKELIIKITII